MDSVELLSLIEKSLKKSSFDRAEHNRDIEKTIESSRAQAYVSNDFRELHKNEWLVKLLKDIQNLSVKIEK